MAASRLIGALDAEIDDVDQRFAIFALWENAEGIFGHSAIMLGPGDGVDQSAMFIHHGHCRFQITIALVFLRQCAAPELAVFFIAPAIGQDDG